ncbi:MAG: ATP-binding protein [Clostridia bacterium]|nr:ATP-binding protein [Clostridia bacterium]
MGAQLFGGVGEETFYKHPSEHIEDILKSFMLRLYIEFHRFRFENTESPFESLKGLVITEEEIFQAFSCGKNREEDRSSEADLVKLLDFQKQIDAREKASREKGIRLPLVHLSEVFKLSSFEFSCVVLCLAVELDLKFEKIYAYLQDDVTRKSPTLWLATRLFCRNFEEELAVRQYFSPDSALSKYILNAEELSKSSLPFIMKPLKLNERIVDFLTGNNRLDHFLKPFACLNPYAKNNNLYKEYENSLFEEQILLDVKNSANPFLLHFYGSEGAGKTFEAQLFCEKIGKNILVIDIMKVLNSGQALKEVLDRILCESLLHGAVPCFYNFHFLNLQDITQRCIVTEFFESFLEHGNAAILLSETRVDLGELKDHWVILEKAFNIPPIEERREFWEAFGRKYEFKPDVNMHELSLRFKLTPGQIKKVLREAYSISISGGVGGKVTLDSILEAYRRASKINLGSIGQKVEPSYNWKDIVLPEDLMQQLSDICNFAKNKAVVFEKWGFGKKHPRGKGLNILFSGGPGTGKTMAAEIIANKLGLEMYKIDLSQVVSKYIGETEKNFYKIFEEAKREGVILFFDEADALFGRRSEIKDSHDRYANIEVAYLLQKMEEYEGISILATNLSKSMDEAFIRRMSYCVDFPFPDYALRKRIWNGSFPENAFLDEIDFDFLAKEIKLAGGNIKNIVLAASVAAVSEKSPVKMKHILYAAKREYQKAGIRFDIDFPPEGRGSL